MSVTRIDLNELRALSAKHQRFTIRAEDAGWLRDALTMANAVEGLLRLLDATNEALIGMTDIGKQENHE